MRCLRICAGVTGGYFSRYIVCGWPDSMEEFGQLGSAQHAEQKKKYATESLGKLRINIVFRIVFGAHNRSVCVYFFFQVKLVWSAEC